MLSRLDRIIEVYMKLCNLYHLLIMSDWQNLDLLLKYIANIVDKHTDPEVVLFCY